MANKKQQLTYKNNCCKYCGRNVKEMVEEFGSFNRVFEFNHTIPSLKSPIYDNIIRNTISTEQLDELDKCILLCKICHGILHSQNISIKLILNVEVGDKKVTQELMGQGILNRKEKHLKFLTNQKLLVKPYLLQRDSEAHEIIFGKDLEENSTFLSNLFGAKNFHICRIFNYKKTEEFFTATKIDNSTLKISHNIKFPYFQYELVPDDKDIDYLWIRNGFALTKDGDVVTNGTLDYELEI